MGFINFYPWLIKWINSLKIWSHSTCLHMEIEKVTKGLLISSHNIKDNIFNVSFFIMGRYWWFKNYIINFIKGFIVLKTNEFSSSLTFNVEIKKLALPSWINWPIEWRSLENNEGDGNIPLPFLPSDSPYIVEFNSSY